LDFAFFLCGLAYRHGAEREHEWVRTERSDVSNGLE